MSDWSTQQAFYPASGVIASNSFACGTGQTGNITFATAAVWPAANKAIYIAFYVEATVTAYQMGLWVATQSGNLDVGIYDTLGNRKVSKGSTAVAAAGVQLVDITDTVLTPGAYFMAMCVDNTTASFRRYTSIDIQTLRAAGLQEQAVGAVTLPDPATFANPAAAYIPLLVVATKSTI